MLVTATRPTCQIRWRRWFAFAIVIGLVNGTWPPLTTWLTFHPLCLAATGNTTAESEPMMITDLSHCTPRCALATTPELDRWRVIEYQADGISEKMIGAQGLMETLSTNTIKAFR